MQQPLNRLGSEVASRARQVSGGWAERVRRHVQKRLRRHQIALFNAQGHFWRQTLRRNAVPESAARMSRGLHQFSGDLVVWCPRSRLFVAVILRLLLVCLLPQRLLNYVVVSVFLISRVRFVLLPKLDATQMLNPLPSIS